MDESSVAAYVRVFNKSVRWKQFSDLNATDFAVLLALILRTQPGNVVYTYSSIREEIGAELLIHQRTVYRAVLRLTASRFLYKIKTNKYLLSPSISWLGNEKERLRLIQELNEAK